MTEAATTGADRTCFVARPISITESAAALYAGDMLHWQHVEESLIIPALEATGYRHIPTPARGAGLIHAHVIEAVNQADLVIADFSQLNPNVFFEAGVRTAVNKPLLVIAENETKLPFDIAGINTWFYDPRLQHWEVDAMIADLVQHIEDTNTEGNELWSRFGARLQAQEFAAAHPGDPTAAAIKQISLDMNELKESQAELGRRLSSPSDGVSLRTPAMSTNSRTRVERAIVRLVTDLVNAGASAELINEVDERCDALLRKEVVLGPAAQRNLLLDDLSQLVAGSTARPNALATNDLAQFKRTYAKYAESVRRDYGHQI